MITYLKSNLFFSPAQVLVNTVNTEGVMGKGIAKEFKKHFPEMFQQYHKFCEEKKLDIGNLWLYKTTNKWVLSFPTKKSWRNPSKIEYLEKGLQKFVDQYENRGIKSIAFPPLGCGNGELNWETQVRPLMEKYLKDLPIDIYIHLYTPSLLEDVPEHKHIKNISRWLQSEPQFLSLTELLENLKSLCAFEYPEEWKGLILSFSENYDLVIESGKQKIIWTNEDLLDLWSILRKHGIVSRENIPSSFTDNYELFLNVFSKLPYLSVTEAVINYNNINENSLALQFLPHQKEGYDKSIAI